MICAWSKRLLAAGLALAGMTLPPPVAAETYDTAPIVAHFSDYETSFTGPSGEHNIFPGWRTADGVAGEYTLTSRTALRRAIATDKVSVTPPQSEAGDVNASGHLMANDALMILQYATGKIAAFVPLD